MAIYKTLLRFQTNEGFITKVLNSEYIKVKDVLTNLGDKYIAPLFDSLNDRQLLCCHEATTINPSISAQQIAATTTKAQVRSSAMLLVN